MGTANARSELTLSTADLLLLVTSCCIGAAVAACTSLASGYFLALTLMIWCRTRRKPYAAIPGAAVCVTLVWLELPMSFTTLGEIERTALAATFGACLNAIVCGFRLTGSLGLTALVVPAVGVMLWQFVAPA